MRHNLCTSPNRHYCATIDDLWNSKGHCTLCHKYYICTWIHYHGLSSCVYEVHIWKRNSFEQTSQRYFSDFFEDDAISWSVGCFLSLWRLRLNFFSVLKSQMLHWNFFPSLFSPVEASIASSSATSSSIPSILKGSSVLYKDITHEYRRTYKQYSLA